MVNFKSQRNDDLMTKRKKTGPTADRYIEETLQLIGVYGGSS